MYTLNVLSDECKTISNYTRYLCDEFTELKQLKHAVNIGGMSDQLDEFAQLSSSVYKRYRSTIEGTNQVSLLMNKKYCVAAIEGMLQDVWKWIVDKWNKFIDILKKFIDWLIGREKAEAATIDTILTNIEKCNDVVEKDKIQYADENVISDISEAMLDRMDQIIQLQINRGSNILNKIKNAKTADELKNEKQDEYKQEYFKLSNSYKEFRFASEYHEKNKVIKLLNNLKGKLKSFRDFEVTVNTAKKTAEDALKEAQSAASKATDEQKELLSQKVRVFGEYTTNYLIKAISQFVKSVEMVFIPCNLFVKYAGAMA